MKKVLIIVMMCCLGLGSTMAQKERRVPARPGVVEHIQPNGDTVHICLRGDERRHWIMTTDGWQVEVNNRGVLCYAVAKKDGFRASKHVAHDADNRRRKEMRFLRRRGIKK